MELKLKEQENCILNWLSRVKKKDKIIIIDYRILVLYKFIIHGWRPNLIKPHYQEFAASSPLTFWHWRFPEEANSLWILYNS